MKLIIDINENVYTRLFDNGIQDNEIATDDVCEMARALRLGTPIPDNVCTNRDMIKAMFPNCDETGVQYELTKNCNGWLDEPYQKRGCFK